MNEILKAALRLFSTYRINFGHCMVSDNYDDLDYARWALNKLRAENVEHVEKYHLEGWDGRRWHPLAGESQSNNSPTDPDPSNSPSDPPSNRD